MMEEDSEVATEAPTKEQKIEEAVACANAETQNPIEQTREAEDEEGLVLSCLFVGRPNVCQ